jgi:hypothetical protein
MAGGRALPARPRLWALAPCVSRGKGKGRDVLSRPFEAAESLLGLDGRDASSIARML